MSWFPQTPTACTCRRRATVPSIRLPISKTSPRTTKRSAPCCCNTAIALCSCFVCSWMSANNPSFIGVYLGSDLPSTHRRQFLVDGLNLERLRVETPADPFQHLLVRLVARILDGVEEVAVAPGTATIFRWAGSTAFHAAGILHLRIGVQHLLYLDDVFPIVAHVVGVPELFDTGLDELTQLGLAGAGEVEVAASVDHIVAVLFTVDVKEPHMVVVP